MSRRYPDSYPYPYPQSPATAYSDDDGASQASSSTSYSQQPSWPTSPRSTSRTYRDPSVPRYSPSASPIKTLYEPLSPNYMSRSSALSAAQPRPQPIPAYSFPSDQASMVGSGAGVQRGSFDYGRPDLIPGGTPPPRPSPTQYQQPRNADTPLQRRSSKSIGSFLKGLASPRRNKLMSIDEFDAGSPPLPSRGELVADKRRRDSIPRSAQYPNFGSDLRGRIAGEPKNLPMAWEDFSDRPAAQTNARSSSGGNGLDFNPYYYNGTGRKGF